jgi:hypothetical protein
MDIKDSKDTHKIDLKNLLEDLNNAPKQPSWLGGLNPPDSLGSTNLSTLSYHEGRLVVLSEPGVYDLLNGSKKHKNKKVLKEAFDRVMYALKYENSVGLVDIFSFSFPTFGVEQPLILTQSLLKWLGYKGVRTRMFKTILGGSWIA